MIESVSEVVKKNRGRQSATVTDMDRLPPHDVPMERGVLGCCLQDPATCMGICLEQIKGNAKVFYDLRHQTIYGVLRELFDAHLPIDLITVREQLNRLGALEQIGGDTYLGELQDAVPSAANLSYYLTVVKQKFLLRQMIATCAAMVGRAYDYDGSEPDKLLLECEAEIAKLTETETAVGEEHIGPVLQRVVTDMEENRYIRGRTQMRGLPTGVPGNYLDKLIRGIRDTFYFVVAGRPGDGKTSWVMNVVEHLATDYVWQEKTGREIPHPEKPEETIPEVVDRRGIPVGVFSIEMDADSLGYRLLFGRANVDMAEYAQGYKQKGDDERLCAALRQLSTSKIYIDATPAQSIGQIAAKARRMVKQYGIKLFVLDYLQLVEQEGGNGFDRVKELTKISRKIMALKKQLKVPWMVLAQMNRNIETAESKRAPVLSDLKDCGAIEQDCDAALFLYKPSRKELEDSGDKDILDRVCADWDWSKRPYRVNFMVAKNRFGPTGVAQMVFSKNLTRFEDWHLWKVKHGAEERKEGESKHLGEELPTNEELNAQ